MSSDRLSLLLLNTPDNPELPVDNVRSPMSMFRKHCHKNCKDDEVKWHLLIASAWSEH